MAVSKPTNPVVPEADVIQEDIFRNGRKIISKQCLLTVTLRCNQRCLFCPNVREDPGFSDARIRRILEAYCRRNKSRIKVTSLNFTGGEPTLSPGLPKLVRLAKDLGFRTRALLTNGLAMSDPDLTRALYDAGIDDLLFSFHSHRESVYDRLTDTSGLYPRALRGFRNAFALPFKSIGFSTVLTRYNFMSLPEHAAFLAGLSSDKRPGTRVAWLLSIMNDNPSWDKVCVPYSKIVPYLLRVLKERRLPVENFTGDCAMPVCIGGLGAGAPQLAPDASIDLQPSA